jgi:hypothetical protein
VSNVDTKLEKLEAAKHELANAEREIETLMRAIPIVARAEKTSASQAVEAAFRRLRAAQASLGELAELLRKESD